MVRFGTETRWCKCSTTRGHVTLAHPRVSRTQLNTVSAEEFDKAVLAVRFVVLLLERAFVQLFKAEGADEMLGVKLLAHGGDAAAGYRLLTAGAERAASLVIMCLAVRLTLVLEETAIHERNETLLQTQRRNKAGV